MKSYIILTNQGFTESPIHQEVFNQQVLGYQNGNTENEAIENLITENPQIVVSGFTKDEMIGKELK
jgi:hypothetical protein